MAAILIFNLECCVSVLMSCFKNSLLTAILVTGLSPILLLSPARAATPIPVPPSRSDEPVIDVSPSTPYTLCKGSEMRTWDKCIGTTQLGDLGEYSGEFRKGHPEGSGRFNGRDGSVFLGEFRNGAPSGKGKFTSAKGNIYLGSFANGVADGEGRETTPDGMIYVGTYVKGVREGQGRLDYPDGRHFIGEFKADHINGYGTYSFPNGDEYTGVVEQDALTDRGIYRFANGDRYVGPYSNFKPTGQGVYTFASGMKWIGEFRNGIPFGKGMLDDSNGELIFEGDVRGFESITQARASYEEKKQSAAKASLAAASSTSASSPASGIDTSKPQSASGATPQSNLKSDPFETMADVSVAPKSEAVLLQQDPVTPSDQPPLKCHRAGDVLVLFISCDVVVPQAIIDDITFSDHACLSGKDYLAVYDQARSAPWSDMFNHARAYFYFRPFDYRGAHRYREKIYFLVSGCKNTSDFVVLVNQQEWVWTLASDAPKRIR